MKKELPRGLHYRGDSIVATFALADGRIERRSLGEVSESWAKEELSRFKRQVREGNYQKKQPRPEPTPKLRPVIVSDLLQPYLRNYRNKGKRAESRQLIAWDHLKETFADVPVEELTTDQIEKYIESRREGITEEKARLSRNGTINRELSLLRAMLTHGTKVTPRRVHQMAAFPDKLEENEPRQGFIEDAQYRVLASNAKVLWLRALLSCAYHFGFRKNELLKLRVKQVDLFDRAISLERRQTKGNKARRIFLTEETFQLLAACISGKKENDFVFTRENGEPVCDPREEWAGLCVASEFGEWYRPSARTAKSSKPIADSTYTTCGEVPYAAWFAATSVRKCAWKSAGTKPGMYSTPTIFPPMRTYARQRERLRAVRKLSPVPELTQKLTHRLLETLMPTVENGISVLERMAGTTRLELATSAVTGQRSNQLNYVPAVVLSLADGGQCRARTCDLLLVRQAL